MNKPNNNKDPMRAGFLFNHYMTYQLMHGAPFAFELSRLYSDIQVELLCSTPELYAEAERIGALYPDHKCTFRLLNRSSISRFIPAHFHHFHRPMMLLTNRKLLATFDALIAPEKNYILLKLLPAFSNILFIGLRHGAGDRPVLFNKGWLKFDFLLVPGQSYFERFKNELPKGCCKIVGCPKFEVLEKLHPETPRLFRNERPVVLYTPHFHRQQSSWRTWGRQILDFFAKSDHYNLIFAPHPRLFKHSMYHDNISISEFNNVSNILIDTGSDRSFDMTYSRAADVYLGDVSSQVYEFIYYRRRSCVFLNPNELDQAQMNFWRFGPVLDEIDTLEEALVITEQKFEKDFQIEQDIYVKAAFSSDKRPPSQRGAEVIGQFLLD